MLHYGHVKHLEAAKKLGDFLIVALTKDGYVRKGPGRPVFDQYKRLHMLQALRCVDEVYLCADVMEVFKARDINIFVKGQDYVGKMELGHQEYCRDRNIPIVFTNEEQYSSTKLMNL